MQVEADFPRGNILGVGVSAIHMEQAVERIEAWIRAGRPEYVCVTPAHAVMACQDDEELRAIYNHSGLTTPDGMAIVWLLRWAGFSTVERVYGPDLLQAMCARSVGRGYRHYFYGGAPGVAAQLAQRLQRDYPGLIVAGVESPPYRRLTEEEDQAVVQRIREAQADVVWVGIGSPRQERWMHAHYRQLGKPVLVGVGAAFDFLSGRKPQAPRWVQRAGLEWLYRLVSEPRRLWKRYLLGYPRFVGLVFMQRMGWKRFPLEPHGS
ncbi:MAG: WecB/TagA/CpsF family glycosyltransferase [Anaerolineaceae bacterium]|nr:WecB/TagA/CpsF family glycosyltransferase [Anaerolineaceae bacterium]